MEGIVRFLLDEKWTSDMQQIEDSFEKVVQESKFSVDVLYTTISALVRAALPSTKEEIATGMYSAVHRGKVEKQYERSMETTMPAQESKKRMQVSDWFSDVDSKNPQTRLMARAVISLTLVLLNVVREYDHLFSTCLGVLTMNDTVQFLAEEALLPPIIAPVGNMESILRVLEALNCRILQPEDFKNIVNHHSRLVSRAINLLLIRQDEASSTTFLNALRNWSTVCTRQDAERLLWCAEREFSKREAEEKKGKLAAEAGRPSVQEERKRWRVQLANQVRMGHLSIVVAALARGEIDFPTSPDEQQMLFRMHLKRPVAFFSVESRAELAACLRIIASRAPHEALARSVLAFGDRPTSELAAFLLNILITEFRVDDHVRAHLKDDNEREKALLVISAVRNGAWN